MPEKYIISHSDREPARNEPLHADDPVLAMLGVGSQLWEMESGDHFVGRLRSEDLPPARPTQRISNSVGGDTDVVWRRVAHLQGELFQTVRGLPLTFEVEGNGIWFFRAGKRINRKLTRRQFEVALSRCPLASTTEIKDLIDYPYLFAILMDKRIRLQAW